MTSFYYTRKLIEERINTIITSIGVLKVEKACNELFDNETFDEEIRQCETELKELKTSLNIMKGAETR